MREPLERPMERPLERVLQVGPLLPSLHRNLVEHYDAVLLDEQPDGYLDRHGADFVAVVTTARVGVDRALMDRLPRLRAVVNFGVGYDTTDVVTAAERGIAVSNTPDVLTDCVADTAVGGLIDVMRRFAAADRFVRRGDWARGQYPLAAKVSGKRIGILGLGRIGRAIARRLEGFDAEIAYHSRSRVEGVSYIYAESPEKLAAWSDALIVATSGGAGTRGLVSAAVLEALGPDGYLVNVARGSVVDEPALVAALTGGRLAGAALDVFADEPNVPAALLDLDSVLLLPHIASATRETREAMGDLAFRNLRQFLEKGVLVTPVPAP
ncbi:2-hydroxyacid dehydrogenase [Actinomadura viridis]|uniref:Lactate dehydrogenase-like 2-hydroxyacid dehydrogenase n=1 Tax=Actinomadura viridis TaxID=58110 RepID=A0A931GSC1_9ACTN|nr:2-hydroxyacid dehydrogenase [Actinomadura viridis]MBG6093786.1 lactate dehydrogenase-like 2-hydroxyacid dehydrogenase [Actinomadura viridis]